MKILVTGSSGFVGKPTVERLKELGHEVVEYDLPRYDILNLEQIKANAKDCDVICHIAAIADLYETAKDFDPTFNTNVRGTYNIMLAAKELDKHLVYISTCCVYGVQNKRTTEENLPNPNEFYARSKLAGEVLVQDLDNVTILRLGTILGEGMRKALFNYKILLNNVLRTRQIQDKLIETLLVSISEIL